MRYRLRQPSNIILVGMVGLEPTRPYGQRILSPHCLPIPAHSHMAELIGLEPIHALRRYSRFSKPVPYRLGLKLLINDQQLCADNQIKI